MRTVNFVREKFIDMWKARRGPVRCALVKQLHEDFKEAHMEEYTEIEALEVALVKANAARTAANNKASKAQTAVSFARSKMSNLKTTEHLTYTEVRVPGRCGIGELHTTLAAFDAETDRKITIILTQEEIGPEILELPEE